MYLNYINTDDFSIYQLEKIKKSILQITEIENEKNAKELHDDFGQKIIFIKYLFEIYSDNNDNKILENQIKKSITSLYEDLRQMIDNRSVTSKIDFCLKNFIHNQKEKIDLFKPNFLHINFCSMECILAIKNLNKDVSINLIRITQEFISNSLKHSFANGLSISLFFFKNKLYLLLMDNGIGFSFKEETNGNGIKNIFWRLNLLDSKYSFNSDTNGTTLFIEI